MTEPLSVIVTVNSPGEVSGWLRPFLKALKQAAFKTSVTVFIPPCTFASGSECAVVKAMPEVDKVVEPSEVWRYIFLGQAPEDFVMGKVGVVLFLGGDLTWTNWIAKRLHYPAVAYTEGFANWVGDFLWFAQPYPAMKEKLVNQGVPEIKLPLVGNLMIDAVQPTLSREQVRNQLNVADRPLLLLMPGSRPAHFEYMLPFLLDVFTKVKEEAPNIEAVISISPFIGDAVILKSLNSPDALLWGKSGEYYPNSATVSSMEQLEKPSFIKLDNGLTIPVFRGMQYDIMAAADLAVTIPGTNTMELSFMGVPMVIAIPLMYPERIPLEGVAGLIENIPLIGRLIKKRLIPKLALQEKYKYTAWPNRIVQDYVVPELRGNITAAQVSNQLISFINDQSTRERLSNNLQAIGGEKGAANSLVRLIENVLNPENIY